MQVIGLPGYVTRAGRSASRLLAAEPADCEAEGRRDAVARWVGARKNGLSAVQAARAVGVARSTLYRWQQDARLSRADPMTCASRPGHLRSCKPSRTCVPTTRCGGSAS